MCFYEPVAKAESRAPESFAHFGSAFRLAPQLRAAAQVCANWLRSPHTSSTTLNAAPVALFEHRNLR